MTDREEYKKVAGDEMGMLRVKCEAASDHTKALPNYRAKVDVYDWVHGVSKQRAVQSAVAFALRRMAEQIEIGRIDCVDKTGFCALEIPIVSEETWEKR